MGREFSLPIYFMKKVKLVIFDLDGTLVDAYGAITASFNFCMRRLRYPVQRPAVIRRAVGGGDKNLLAPFLRAQDSARALSLYRRHHAGSLIRKARLFSGSWSVLSHLKTKGYILAVATNRPTRFSLVLIRHLKIRAFFDYVLCADKLKKGKPHPQIINALMKKAGVKKSETVYVGDMVIDAQAGRRAGVKTIIVTTGSSHKNEIKKEKPYRIIPRIQALLKIV